MSCRHLIGRSPLKRRWHLLWCPQCRAERKADAILIGGIDGLKAELPPPYVLTDTLAAVGLVPIEPRSRIRRWKRLLYRILMPLGGATILLACSWSYYMDLDPYITIPPRTTTLQNADAYYVRALKGEKDTAEINRYAIGDNYNVVIHLSNGARTRVEILSPKRKQALIAANAETFALLRRGARTSNVVSAAGFQNLSDLLKLKADVCEGNGDLMGAANCGLDAIQLGVQTNHCDYEEDGRPALWSVIDRLNASQARSATRRLEQILTFRVPYTDTLQAKKWQGVTDQIALFQDRNWRSRLGKQGSAWSAAAKPIGDWTFGDKLDYLKTLPYSKRWIIGHFMAQMDREIDAYRLPYCVGQVSMARDKRHWSFDRLLELADPHLANCLGTESDDEYFLRTHCETQNALLLVALALRAYQQEHHANPETLAVLTPGYLPAIPTDPFNGKPLGYRRIGENFVLYSVGPDGKDDNGIPIDRLALSRVPKGRMDSRTAATQGRYVIYTDSNGDIRAGTNIRVGFGQGTTVIVAPNER